MKKLKEGNPYSVLEDPKIRLKHVSLLQDLEDLQKDTEAVKKKLRAMKRRKQTLLAEVGFLKQRYNYLKSNPSMARRKSVDNKKQKNSSKKQTLGFSTNKTPIFDLNQRARFLVGSKFNALKSSNLDSNQGNGKRVVAPIFDLNRVSREEEEEEELQVGDELPLKMEEMRGRYLRDEDGDERRTETKMSICRNAGNGSRRVGKRKISWQDQVALRV